jgi:integrase
MAKTFQKLTRLSIRGLRAGGEISEHGITFERLPNGDGLFTINVMVDGQRIHRTIGKESDGTTRTQAEDFIEKVRRDAREDRLSLPKGRKIALSFRDAAAKYLAKLEEEGGRDLVMKRQRLTLHLVPFFGDRPLSKISNFDIDRYKKQRLQEDAMRGGDRRSENANATQRAHPPSKTSPGSVNRELAVLSHLFNKAIEWKWIDRRPAKITRLKEGAGRITYLTVDQVQRLLEAAKRDQNWQIYPFIVIALETSMRRMEVLSIRREHVDLQRRIIYVPKAKAGAREQPITAHLAQFLAAHIAALPKGTPWLFPSPAAREGHTIDIRKPFRRVVVAAEMNPAEVLRHTLRHTAITHLVQAGVDLPTVKRISGHKTLAMVEKYSHQNGEHIQAAMDKLESRLKFA